MKKNFFLFAFLFSDLAFAGNLLCNRAQTLCEIDNTDLTTGDKVAIFSPDKELLAQGTVKSMDGKKRRITITKKFGPIKNDSDVVLMDQETPESEFRVFKNPSKYSVGGNLAVGSMNIGSGATMMGFEGYGLMRWKYDLEIIADVGFTNLDGKVTGPAGTVPFMGSLFHVLAGAGMTQMKKGTISLHEEIGLGVSYLSASVNGSGGDVGNSEYSTHVNNGIGFMLRGSASVVYNRNDWHILGGFSAGIMQSPFFASLHFGLMKDLK